MNPWCVYCTVARSSCISIWWGRWCMEGPIFALVCTQRKLAPLPHTVLWSRKFFFQLRLPKPQIRIATLAPAPAPDSFIRYLTNYLFWLRNRIKIVTILINFLINYFSNYDFFSWKFLQACGKSEGARAAIHDFGFGFRRQFNSGSSAPAPQKLAAYISTSTYPSPSFHQRKHNQSQMMTSHRLGLYLLYGRAFSSLPRPLGSLSILSLWKHGDDNLSSGFFLSQKRYCVPTANKVILIFFNRQRKKQSLCPLKNTAHVIRRKTDASMVVWENYYNVSEDFIGQTGLQLRQFFYCDYVKL